MNSVTKKIKIATWTIVSIGLLTEVVPIFYFKDWMQNIWIYVLWTFQFVNLFAPGLRFFNSLPSLTGIMANPLNISFLLLLLAGGVLYTISKGKEIRLLRFCFSILLICNCLYFVGGFLGLFKQDQLFSLAFSWWLMFFVQTIKTAAVALISWWILKQLNQTRSLATEPTPTESETEYVTASRWHRFFHLVIDTVLCLLIFSPIVYLFNEDFLRKLEQGLGERLLLFFLLLIFRTIYYPFFETLLGATPAKLFSETRIITRTGKPISFGISLGRTFSRFVPFEPFSFLGNTGGWHDRWTETKVVKEARLGVAGIRYFLAVPVILIVGLLAYFGNEAYRDYKYYIFRKTEHEKKIALFEKQLNNLSTSHFIEIKDSKGYDSKRTYLKIEDVDKDNAYASVFEIDQYDVTAVGVGEFYDQRNELLNKIFIKKTDLHKAYTKDYDLYSKNKKMTANLLQDGTEYEIEQIFMYHAPIINNDGGSSRYGNELSLSFRNCGWNGTLTEIKNIEGNIEWMDELPMSIESVAPTQYSCAQFTVHGTNYKQGTPYAFELVIRDESNRSQRFIVEGTDLDRTMRQVE